MDFSITDVGLLFVHHRVAQIAQQKANVEEAVHEMAKPLARHKDDQDLDAMLKDQDREGDPMLAFMKKKKNKSKEKVKGLYWRFSKLLALSYRSLTDKFYEGAA